MTKSVAPNIFVVIPDLKEFAVFIARYSIV